MNSLNPLEPVSALIKAVTFPIKFVFVVGLCYTINWFTFDGHWWAQWVAFGMGIGLLCVWARAIKVLVVTVGIVGAGYLIRRWWTQRTPNDATAGAFDARTIDVGGR